MRGHQAAQLDPLGLWQRKAPADLSIHHYGLTDADLDTTFRTGELFIGKEEATLREIHQALHKGLLPQYWCKFTHIVDFLNSASGLPAPGKCARSPVVLRRRARPPAGASDGRRGLEKYRRYSKYPDTKRFGLEGGESLIALLDEIIQRSGSYGTKEIVIGWRTAVASTSW